MMTFGATDWIHAALVVILIFVFPVWDTYEASKLRRSPSSAGRVRLYTLIIVWLWIVTAILVATVPLSDLLNRPRTTWQPSAALVIGVVVGVTVGLFAPVLSALRGSADAARGLRPVEFMLPRGAHERLLWVAVAITAGVCEEIIFRGFLIRYFEAWVGLGPAIVAAAAVFALDHAYQV